MKETDSREKRTTTYENCIMPLLKALKWHGNIRSVKESMPHFTRIKTANAFRGVLENLSFESSVIDIKFDALDERLLPALLVTEDNDVMVFLARDKRGFRVFDGVTNKENIIPIQNVADIFQKGSLYVFRKKKSEDKKTDQRGWFWVTLKKSKGLLYSAIFLSLILNVLMLATPLFVMSVYDRVIGASSYSMLGEFGIGIFLALLGLFLIYRVRSEHLALIGARFDKMIGDRIMSQLLYLAPSYTETATAGAQVARIKDFDRVREFFSGPMLSIFFEVPFIIIALALIAVLGGSLVLVPVCMIIAFALVGSFLSIKINIWIRESARTFSELQEFLLEAIGSIRVIKCLALVSRWSQRYREKSAKSHLIGIRLTVYDGVSTAISEMIMITAGMLILAFGAVKAMHGTLDMGAMLALMMIVWRVLAPIRAIVNTLPRLIQLSSSIRQINRLMALKPETEQMVRAKQGKINFKGDVGFLRLSMRYPTAYVPSLLAVSFMIEAGSLVAIAGRNGSGKSTLLKVILGLYQPQAGSVLIDGRDIRQLNPIDLRSSIGYLPQNPELFFGTIEGNLRLGDPVATNEAIRQATQDAGILESILNMPLGFETKIHDQSTQRLSSSFCQSLCLARAYLRNASILLLDEPGNTLDIDADQQLMKHLDSLRGKKTVIMVTHRPSHLSKADKIFWMDQGQLVLQGAPSEVLEKIPFDLL